MQLNLDLPNEISTREGRVLSTADLILSAIGGRVGARVRVMDTDKNIRTYLAEDSSVITEKIAAATAAEGHLILRHELRVHMPESSGSTVYHVRAVYVLRKH